VRTDRCGGPCSFLLVRFSDKDLFIMAHNIRENDNMIAVGTTPWHGLGVTLKEAPETALKALQLAQLDWEVRKLPMQTETGRAVVLAGSVSESNDGRHGVIERVDTREFLGVVGPAYQPYQNRQLANLFEPLVKDKTVTIETCGSLFNGRRVWMLAKFGQDIAIAAGDDVAKYLLLAHGHDGQMSAHFGFTPIRVVCHNTLSAAMRGEESKLVRCLHTSNLGKNLEILRESIVAGEQMFEVTAEVFRKLASKGVSKADLKEFARVVIDGDEDEKKWTRPEQAKIKMIVENATKGKGNSGSNWWHAYNGVTEYVCWQAGRSADKRLSESWWGEGRKMSQKALNAATVMAGLV
jgi:phage/plasmid-like protein (TIGR03299 family)